MKQDGNPIIGGVPPMKAASGMTTFIFRREGT
jgi:hypothetical protein